MKQIRPTSQFQKALKKVHKNAKRKAGISILQNKVMPCLQKGTPLDKQLLDHPLSGMTPFEGDCHILNDLVLIDRTDNEFVYLIR